MSDGELNDQDKLKRRGALDNIMRRRQLTDIQTVLGTIEGRRFYWRVLCECGLFKTSFTGNNTTFFNEGMRQIGLMLMAELNEAHPQAYLLMLSESKTEEAKNG
jgi:hypothetical protein